MIPVAYLIAYRIADWMRRLQIIGIHDRLQFLFHLFHFFWRRVLLNDQEFISAVPRKKAVLCQDPG